MMPALFFPEAMDEGYVCGNPFSLCGCGLRLKIYSFVAALSLRENVTARKTAKDAV